MPSSVYLWLRHRAFRAYPAELTKRDDSGKEFAGADKIYEIFYPKLKRQLRIYYASECPHKIFEWEESYKSGWAKVEAYPRFVGKRNRQTYPHSKAVFQLKLYS